MNSKRHIESTVHHVHEQTHKPWHELVKVYGAEEEDGTEPTFFHDPFGRKDFQASVLKAFLPRLGIAALVFFLGTYLMCCSQAALQHGMTNFYQDRWLPNPKFNITNSTPRLWDVTYATLPYVKSTKPADAFATAAPLLVFLRFVVVPGPLSLRWTILCRFLVCIGLVYAFRGITIIVTPLPNPDYTCVPKIRFPENAFLEGFAIMFKGDITCQDVLYSGHTIMLTTSMLFMFRYIPLAPWFPSSADDENCSFQTFFNIAGVLILLTGYYFIAASHFHYTVDVLVGAMVSFLMFSGYHHWIRTAWFRTSHRFSFYPAFRWFEMHAKDMSLWRKNARSALNHMKSRKDLNDMDAYDSGAESGDSETGSE